MTSILWYHIRFKSERLCHSNAVHINVNVNGWSHSTRDQTQWKSLPEQHACYGFWQYDILKLTYLPEWLFNLKKKRFLTKPISSWTVEYKRNYYQNMTNMFNSKIKPKMCYKHLNIIHKLPSKGKIWWGILENVFLGWGQVQGIWISLFGCLEVIFPMGKGSFLYLERSGDLTMSPPVFLGFVPSDHALLHGLFGAEPPWWGEEGSMGRVHGPAIILKWGCRW